MCEHYPHRGYIKAMKDDRRRRYWRQSVGLDLPLMWAGVPHTYATGSTLNPAGWRPDSFAGANEAFDAFRAKYKPRWVTPHDLAEEGDMVRDWREFAMRYNGTWFADGELRPELRDELRDGTWRSGVHPDLPPGDLTFDEAGRVAEVERDQLFERGQF